VFIVKMNSLSKKGEQVLTSRELEILRFIVNGKSNRPIAADLKLSVNTVRVHRANIMAAVGIHKGTQLVVYAMRNGLVAPPEQAEWE
jgi:DNA-binding NarL/FixJ family response regulator